MSNLLILIFMKFFIKTPSNLYLFWNIGSLLMIILTLQVIFGLMLSMHYFSLTNDMYINSFLIMMNFHYGWMLRFFHSNMTSLIFVMIFFHMIRSMIYMNYLNKSMWNSGILMLMILMMISFLGYSLIMSQMSFWASMVITNFLAIIPLIGNKFMTLIWGNQFINNILLNRFFSLHFLLALFIILISMIHLMILHMKKSHNPININNNLDQINLNPLLIFKDLFLMILLLLMFLLINFLWPIKLNNYDNFNKMMIFKTPNHIEPEWYFLFFYTILRSNENKMNGLILMLSSILILMLIPYINKMKFMTNKYLYLNKLMNKMFFLILILITFIGMKISKKPYIYLTKKLIFMYFLSFFFMFINMKIINNM